MFLKELKLAPPVSTGKKSKHADQRETMNTKKKLKRVNNNPASAFDALKGSAGARAVINAPNKAERSVIQVLSAGILLTMLPKSK